MPKRHTCLSITVELVEGRGEMLWPRPGRMFVASKKFFFADLAEAIDSAFARWDRSHLSSFELFPAGADHRVPPTLIIEPDEDFEEDEGLSPEDAPLAMLDLGQQFLYTFDFGDGWTHLCTVGDELVDPEQLIGLRDGDLFGPLPYFGWGSIPDQYGRRYRDDDGSGDLPPNPLGADLPPLLPHWGRSF